jgi:cathepsin L
MKLLLFSSLSTARSAPPRWHELSTAYTYDAYLTDWSPVRSSVVAPRAGSAEYVLRAAAFQTELKSVMAHNELGDSAWKRGINQFSDRTAEEFHAVSLSPAASIKSRALAAAAAATSELAAPAPRSSSSLPTTVDWRAKGVLTAVKNQQECGSCWAFASTATIESHAALSRSPPVLADLSPQQLVSCAPNPNHCGGVGGCEGSIPELAYDYIKAEGMASEWSLPYTSGDGGSCEPTCPCAYNKTTMKMVELGGYVKLAPANDQATVMRALAEIGPLAVNVQANTWASYESGVFPATQCGHNATTGAVSNTDIDHVVQLVGYDETSWIIRNSWSPLWGDDGFIRLERGASNASEFCGPDSTPLDGVGCATGPSKSPPVTTVCGTCAVLWDVSYPTGVKYVKQ